MTTQPGANLYTQGFGSRPENVEVPVVAAFAPSSTMTNFPIGKRWIDTSQQQEYVLMSLTTINGVVSATWTALANGSGTIDFIDGDTGSATGTTIDFNAHPTCGETVFFRASGNSVDLFVTDSNSNTTIGSNAGGSATISGTNNTSLGMSALGTIGSGANNTCLGLEAGSTLTSGSNNTSVGSLALHGAPTVIHNVAIGDNALTDCSSNNNTSVGSTSLASLTTSPNNTAVGYQSLLDCATGLGNNTAIGTQTATSLVSGGFNICVGSLAGGAYTGSESSNILIASGGVVGDNHTIRIGNQGMGDNQQNTCFVAGVAGVSVPNTNFVTINTVNGQLGSASSSASLTIDADVGSATGNPITFDAVTNAGQTVLFSASGSTVDLLVSDGNGNTMIGSGAGLSLVSGLTNTCLGVSCGGALNAGSENTAIGNGALSSSDCSGNTAVGASCLANCSGSQNVAMGQTCASNITSGVSNVILGWKSGLGYSGAESSNIVFSNNGTTGESNTTRIGTDGSGEGQQNQCFIAGINGVTVGSPNFVTIDTGTGQLGTTTSAGIVTIDGDVGSVTGTTISILANATVNNCGSSVSFTGSGTNLDLLVTDVNANTLVGQTAGSASVSGGGNSGFGFGAFSALTTGSNNTSAGVFSLSSLVAGANNVAIGFEAGVSIVSSANNTAIGYQCLTDAASTGDDNTAVGGKALFACSGTGNAALGYNIAPSLAAGNYNNLIGFEAGLNYTSSESSNILISNSGVASESHTIRIGTQGAGTGQQFACFLAGLNGITVGSPTNVTIDTVTNQLGVTPSLTAFSGNITANNGNLILATAGNKISIATGSNASVGTATLVAGTVTVSTTAFTGSSIVLLTRQSVGTSTGLGELTISSPLPGTSFVINAATLAAPGTPLATDTSVVGWMIIN